MLIEKYGQLDSQLKNVENPESEVQRFQAMTEIGKQLDDAKAQDYALAQLREEFTASGQTLSPQSNELIEQAKKMVVDLIDRIRLLESDAQKNRDSLEPRIRSGIKANQMQKAYFANNRTR